ncbi:uncharacterized protein LOC125570311 [Nematostella vectensis]|uniref:uncharacterized protein LOC125570311 n=1 Tax=Nematostella vectensis TaxID=45351 RepID=UPI0020778673|nr:uncharacterized protein LOC125570311 [Nematostella vectensis]
MRIYCPSDGIMFPKECVVLEYDRRVLWVDLLRGCLRKGGRMEEQKDREWKDRKIENRRTERQRMEGQKDRMEV